MENILRQHESRDHGDWQFRQGTLTHLQVGTAYHDGVWGTVSVVFIWILHTKKGSMDRILIVHDSIPNIVAEECKSADFRQQAGCQGSAECGQDLWSTCSNLVERPPVAYPSLLSADRWRVSSYVICSRCKQVTHTLCYNALLLATDAVIIFLWICEIL